MAPISNRSDDSQNKTLAKLNSLVDRLKQISVHSKALRQSLHDSQMRVSATLKDLADRVVALEGSEHQLQKVMEDGLARLPEGAVKELLTSKKDSGDLTIGNGQVGDGVLESLAEMVEETTSLMRSSTEKMESARQQAQDIAKLHNMNFYNAFFDDAGNTARGFNYTKLFPSTFSNGDAAQGVNHPKLFSFADGHATRVMVAECRVHAVASCRRQADCSFGETNGTFSRELAKCDALVNVSVFETGFLTGTFALVFVIAFVLCSSFRLLSDRQISAFGLGAIAVCLVTHLSGV